MFKNRMLDKLHEPTAGEISEHIGPPAQEYLNRLEEELESRYELTKALCFPFGNQYGWGYKYSHKSKHLLHLFFEHDAVTATLQIGSGERVEAIAGELSHYARNLWQDRYPCGKKGGGWIHYRITDYMQLRDVLLLTEAKCPLPGKRT